MFTYFPMQVPESVNVADSCIMNEDGSEEDSYERNEDTSAKVTFTALKEVHINESNSLKIKHILICDFENMDKDNIETLIYSQLCRSEIGTSISQQTFHMTDFFLILGNFLFNNDLMRVKFYSTSSTNLMEGITDNNSFDFVLSKNKLILSNIAILDKRRPIEEEFVLASKLGYFRSRFGITDYSFKEVYYDQTYFEPGKNGTTQLFRRIVFRYIDSREILINSNHKYAKNIVRRKSLQDYFFQNSGAFFLGETDNSENSTNCYDFSKRLWLVVKIKAMKVYLLHPNVEFDQDSLIILQKNLFKKTLNDILKFEEEYGLTEIISSQMIKKFIVFPPVEAKKIMSSSHFPKYDFWGIHIKDIYWSGVLETARIFKKFLIYGTIGGIEKEIGNLKQDYLSSDLSKSEFTDNSDGFEITNPSIFQKGSNEIDKAQRILTIVWDRSIVKIIAGKDFWKKVLNRLENEKIQAKLREINDYQAEELCMSRSDINIITQTNQVEHIDKVGIDSFPSLCINNRFEKKYVELTIEDWRRQYYLVWWNDDAASTYKKVSKIEVSRISVRNQINKENWIPKDLLTVNDFILEGFQKIYDINLDNDQIKTVIDSDFNLIIGDTEVHYTKDFQNVLFETFEEWSDTIESIFFIFIDQIFHVTPEFYQKMISCKVKIEPFQIGYTSYDTEKSSSPSSKIFIKVPEVIFGPSEGLNIKNPNIWTDVYQHFFHKILLKELKKANPNLDTEVAMLHSYGHKAYQIVTHLYNDITDGQNRMNKTKRYMKEKSNHTLSMLKSKFLGK